MSGSFNTEGTLCQAHLILRVRWGNGVVEGKLFANAECTLGQAVLILRVRRVQQFQY
jgi:hypothetical protein